MTNFSMDGRELFAQLADKVARGELLITHFVANLQPERQSVVYGMRGEIFTMQSPRAVLDMKVTAVENTLDEPAASRSVQISVPIQVRELIFDGPPEPIYDEDLK